MLSHRRGRAVSQVDMGTMPTEPPNLRDEEVNDGRALEWTAIASQASYPGIDPVAHLLRTSYLMLVRFDFRAGTRRERATSVIVHDVMTCASIACGTAWPEGWKDTAYAFVALYDRISALQDERADRRDELDEVWWLTKRSRGRRGARVRNGPSQSTSDRNSVPQGSVSQGKSPPAIGRGLGGLLANTDCLRAGHVQAMPHTCPLAEAIGGDGTKCSCCEECEGNCAEEV